MKKILAVAALVAWSVAPLRADVPIRQQQKIPAMMGQPAQTEITEVWLGDGVTASISEKAGMIFDSKARKLSMIDHADKTCIEADFPLDTRKLVPPGGRVFWFGVGRRWGKMG